MIGLGMFVIPLVFLAGLAVLLITKRWDGLGLALIFFALSVAAGYWAICQSCSSTAAIGFIFLPFYGAVAGILGWAFGNLKRSDHRLVRRLGWGCLMGAISLVVLMIVDGKKTVQRNESRKAKQRAIYQEIAEDRAAIQSLLQTNRGHEAEVLNPLIAGRTNDRSFLLAALEQPFVSADWLDRLANSSTDLGFELQIVRNPNCRSETLTRLYQTSSYPPYLYQALAIHPHTPPDILRDIYSHRQVITGLEIWLAKNPATPKDVLDEIAHRAK